jgi:23S rRNA (pseudouridine1915-N3)-methyltransferase
VLLRLLTVGKLKDQALRDGVDEYLKRLRRHYSVEWTEVKKESSERSVDEIRRIEGKRVLEAAGQAVLVLLDEKGALVDSLKFSGKLRAWADGGTREVAFAVGGAYGHDAEVKKRAAWAWSLSPLTFTHQHVPLLVAEQLYRASTILRGEPYHNE